MAQTGPSVSQPQSAAAPARAQPFNSVLTDGKSVVKQNKDGIVLSEYLLQEISTGSEIAADQNQRPQNQDTSFVAKSSSPEVAATFKSYSDREREKFFARMFDIFQQECPATLPVPAKEIFGSTALLNIIQGTKVCTVSLGDSYGFLFRKIKSINNDGTETYRWEQIRFDQLNELEKRKIRKAARAFYSKHEKVLQGKLPEDLDSKIRLMFKENRLGLTATNRGIATTGAVGSNFFRDCGLTSQPYVWTRDVNDGLQPGETVVEAYVATMCDGFFEQVSDKDFFTNIHGEDLAKLDELKEMPLNVANAWVNAAKKSGSKDNLTAVVTPVDINLADDNALKVACVFDGHGEKDSVAKYLRDNFGDVWNRVVDELRVDAAPCVAGVSEAAASGAGAAAEKPKTWKELIVDNVMQYWANFQSNQRAGKEGVDATLKDDFFRGIDITINDQKIKIPERYKGASNEFLLDLFKKIVADCVVKPNTSPLFIQNVVAVFIDNIWSQHSLVQKILGYIGDIILYIDNFKSAKTNEAKISITTDEITNSIIINCSFKVTDSNTGKQNLIDAVLEIGFDGSNFKLDDFDFYIYGDQDLITSLQNRVDNFQENGVKDLLNLPKDPKSIPKEMQVPAFLSGEISDKKFFAVLGKEILNAEQTKNKALFLAIGNLTDSKGNTAINYFVQKLCNSQDDGAGAAMPVTAAAPVGPAEGNEKKIIAALLNSGADIFAKNKDDKSAIDYIIESKNKELIDWFFDILLQRTKAKLENTAIHSTTITGFVPGDERASNEKMFNKIIGSTARYFVGSIGFEFNGRPMQFKTHGFCEDFEGNSKIKLAIFSAAKQIVSENLSPEMTNFVLICLDNNLIDHPCNLKGFLRSLYKSSVDDFNRVLKINENKANKTATVEFDFTLSDDKKEFGKFTYRFNVDYSVEGSYKVSNPNLILPAGFKPEVAKDFNQDFLMMHIVGLDAAEDIVKDNLLVVKPTDDLVRQMNEVKPSLVALKDAVLDPNKDDPENGATTIIKFFAKAEIDSDHNTALHYFVRGIPIFDAENPGTDLQIIRALLQNGANIYARNSEGKSPLNYVEDANDQQLIEILLEDAPTLNDYFEWLIFNSCDPENILDKGDGSNLSAEECLMLFLDTLTRHMEVFVEGKDQNDDEIRFTPKIYESGEETRERDDKNLRTLEIINFLQDNFADSPAFKAFFSYSLCNTGGFCAGFATSLLAQLRYSYPDTFEGKPDDSKYYITKLEKNYFKIVYEYRFRKKVVDGLDEYSQKLISVTTFVSLDEKEKKFLVSRPEIEWFYDPELSKLLATKITTKSCQDLFKYDSIGVGRRKKTYLRFDEFLASDHKKKVSWNQIKIPDNFSEGIAEITNETANVGDNVIPDTGSSELPSAEPSNELSDLMHDPEVRDQSQSGSGAITRNTLGQTSDSLDSKYFSVILSILNGKGLRVHQKFLCDARLCDPASAENQKKEFGVILEKNGPNKIAVLYPVTDDEAKSLLSYRLTLEYVNHNLNQFVNCKKIFIPLISYNRKNKSHLRFVELDLSKRKIILFDSQDGFNDFGFNYIEAETHNAGYCFKSELINQHIDSNESEESFLGKEIAKRAAKVKSVRLEETKLDQTLQAGTVLVKDSSSMKRKNKAERITSAAGRNAGKIGVGTSGIGVLGIVAGIALLITLVTCPLAGLICLGVGLGFCLAGAVCENIERNNNDKLYAKYKKEFKETFKHDSEAELLKDIFKEYPGQESDEKFDAAFEIAFKEASKANSPGSGAFLRIFKKEFMLQRETFKAEECYKTLCKNSLENALKGKNQYTGEHDVLFDEIMQKSLKKGELASSKFVDEFNRLIGLVESGKYVLSNAAKIKPKTTPLSEGGTHGRAKKEFNKSPLSDVKPEPVAVDPGAGVGSTPSDPPKQVKPDSLLGVPLIKPDALSPLLVPASAKPQSPALEDGEQSSIGSLRALFGTK